MQKLLSFVLVVFLSVSFLAAAGFSYSDCGRNCCCASNMTAPHHTGTPPAQIKGNCCPEAAAVPCGLKKSQDFELLVCAISAARAETNSAAVTAAYLKGSFSSDIGFKHNRERLSASNSLQSSPIYLQHLSLLI
jgi:hypothetical protein